MFFYAINHVTDSNTSVNIKGGNCYLLFLLGGITGGPPLISRLKQRSKVTQQTKTDENRGFDNI